MEQLGIEMVRQSSENVFNEKGIDYLHSGENVWIKEEVVKVNN